MCALASKGGPTPTTVEGFKSKLALPAKSTKSRDGCRQCRLRRVKCSQERPACRACLDRGLSCPGYEKEFKWSTKYEGDQLDGQAQPRKRRRRQTQPQPQDVPAAASVNLIGVSGSHDGMGLDAAAECRGQHVVSSGNQYETAIKPPSSSTTSHIPPPIVSADELCDQGEDLGLTYSTADNNPYNDVLGHTPASQAPTSPAAHHSSTVADASSDLSVQSGPVFDDEDQESIDGYISRSSSFSSTITRQEARPTTIEVDPANLLRWFYRSQPSSYSDTDLVEHYFTNVCRLYSIFDSVKNPFRALVGSNWDASGSISLAIQSMACAHLANDDRAMVQIGRQKQRQAKISIQNDLLLWRDGAIAADRILLAVLLLGPTVSWHNAGDIGLDYLNIARELVSMKLNESQLSVDGNRQQLEHFFLNAMIYWEMMVAFVDAGERHTSDGDSEELEHQLLQLTGRTTNSSESSQALIKPHPWTGVAPHVTMLFAEVGRIVRRRVSDGLFITASEERWATLVESALSQAHMPSHEHVVDEGDQNTPQDHFIQLAEAYRCAGLLLLYRTFPDVLLRRLISSGSSFVADTSEPTICRWYRTTLALRILSIVESLPLWSGTSCLHPILVLSAGSELRLPDLVLTEQYANTAPSVLQIATARTFAEQRLSDLAGRLPQKPFLRMLDILKETWLQMDMFGVDVHWMQIMYEKGWETIMG